MDSVRTGVHVARLDLEKCLFGVGRWRFRMEAVQVLWKFVPKAEIPWTNRVDVSSDRTNLSLD